MRHRNRVNETKLFEIGWLGGILDGEGCVSIRPNGNSWAYEVNVTSTSETIAEHCSKILRYWGIKHLVKKTGQRHLNPNWNDKFNVRVIQRESILLLLELVYPCLTEKKMRATLLRALISSTIKRPHGFHYYTPNELKLIRKFRALQRKPYKRATLNQAEAGKGTSEGQTTRE